MYRSRVVAMVAVVLLVSAGALGWDCICNPRECEILEPSGCPGLGVVVWDPCRCCKVCARTLGEDCGGFRGTCEPGLKCFEGSCTTEMRGPGDEIDRNPELEYEYIVSDNKLGMEVRNRTVDKFSRVGFFKRTMPSKCYKPAKLYQFDKFW